MKEIVKNLESEMSEVKAKVAQQQLQLQQQQQLLFNLLQEKNERTAAANHLESLPMRSNGSAVSINGLPTSCGDLKLIGHIWSGIYSVMGSAMMESVYCNFSKPPSDPGN